jgi:predicted nucleotidyltransferase
LEINKDFMKLLRVFAKVDVRYLLVGAFAVEYHGQPRTTRHMDLWLDDSAANMERAFRALAEFGAPPIAIDHLNAAPPLDVVWIGVPPNRIDLAKGIRGLYFAEAWLHRETTELGGIHVHVIGRKDLIAAKRECGRAKDLVDAEALEAAPPA